MWGQAQESGASSRVRGMGGLGGVSGGLFNSIRLPVLLFSDHVTRLGKGARLLHPTRWAALGCPTFVPGHSLPEPTDCRGGRHRDGRGQDSAWRSPAEGSWGCGSPGGSARSVSKEGCVRAGRPAPGLRVRGAGPHVTPALASYSRKPWRRCAPLPSGPAPTSQSAHHLRAGWGVLPGRGPWGVFGYRPLGLGQGRASGSHHRSGL